MLEKQQKRYRRHRKIRTKVDGTSRRPRFCVFRSAKHIYAQLVNDEKSITIVAADDRELTPEIKSQKSDKAKEKSKEKEDINTMTNRVATAYKVGMLLAEKASAKNIKKVMFDRGGFKYHGRVKALADGARKGGLQF